jgi:hypothetical protein
MILSLQTIGVRHPIAIMLVTVSVFLLPRLVFLAGADSTSNERGLAEKVRMVKLYTVHEGKSLNRILTKADLQRQEPIEVQGYVTGILILADVQMNVNVDGQTMSKIRKNPDGTYSIKYFGKVGYSEIGMAPSNTYYEKGSREENGSPGFLEGYSLFPRVVGDAVSPACNFQIAVEMGERSCALPIVQKGYDTFHLSKPEPVERKNPIEFQYLGERLDRHMSRPDFNDRLRAVAEGIKSVEKIFSTKLVDRVKIIDYEKVQNAVTCEEKNDIWFYINTFLGEPLEELKTIAEHEALHILVDQTKLAKDLSIRELYSDLRGYESLSRERFAVVAYGVSSPGGSSGENTSHREFFAFIDEKNFIEGMKGGHSSQNVDEFCASFLHSLMFMDRLQANLDRPLKVGDGQPDRFLKPKKRKQILTNYIRTIETMLDAQKDGTENGAGIPSFLRACLEQAEGIQL